MRPSALLTLVTLAGACRDAAEPIQPASAVTAEPSGYEAIDLGTLGGSSTLPAALNNEGQVVGRSQVADGKYHAFLWQEGAMHALAEPPGAITSGAQAINNNGLIAGTAEVSGMYENSNLVLVWENGVARDLGAPDFGLPPAQVIAMSEPGDVLATVRFDTYNDHSLLWLGGVMYDLGRIAHRPETWGSSLNNRGQVVGVGFLYSHGPNDFYAPFLWENGTIRHLGLLGRTPPCGQPDLLDDQPCSEGAATDINERGDVVGYSVDMAGVTRPFLWQDGVLRDLGALAGQNAVAIAINERGEVAGHEGRSPSGNGFLWQSGVTRDIGSLGAGGTRVIAMNNHGEIVGSSFTATGQRHAFVWTSGSIIDLGTGSSEADASEAIAINARGDVLGVSRDCDPPAQCQYGNFGTSRAVLWRKAP